MIIRIVKRLINIKSNYFVIAVVIVLFYKCQSNEEIKISIVYKIYSEKFNGFNIKILNTSKLSIIKILKIKEMKFVFKKLLSLK